MQFEQPDQIAQAFLEQPVGLPWLLLVGARSPQDSVQDIANEETDYRSLDDGGLRRGIDQANRRIVVRAGDVGDPRLLVALRVEHDPVELGVHPVAARSVSLGHAVDVVLGIEGLAERFSVPLHAVKEVAEGDLARKALLAGP